MDEVEQLSIELEGASKDLAESVIDADSSMRAFLEKASELESRQASCIDQGREIEEFLSKFSLSPEEIDVLQSADVDSSKGAKQFFSALSHLFQAYKDCKSMVSCNHYNAGFELLDVLGRHQDTAFERLFEWVKDKCEKSGESAASDDIDAKLQVAMRYLRNVPAYFSQCQDLVISSRRTQVVQRFILALTQGGSAANISGAIDLYSHDAVRYVSDMLAWMHQAIVSEEEFLQTVFGKSSFPPDASDPKEETCLSIEELLARCIQGLGRPLRMRILQSLEGNVTISAHYSLHDLLGFYESNFNRIVKAENAVHAAVKGCLLECKRYLTNSINRQTDAMINMPITYPMDLSVAEITVQCARQIKEILKVHSSALMPGLDERDNCSVIGVLGNIIQPLLQACRKSGQGLDDADLAIYMLNNVAALQVISMPRWLNVMYIRRYFLSSIKTRVLTTAYPASHHCWKLKRSHGRMLLSPGKYTISSPKVTSRVPSLQ